MDLEIQNKKYFLGILFGDRYWTQWYFSRCTIMIFFWKELLSSYLLLWLAGGQITCLDFSDIFFDLLFLIFISFCIFFVNSYCVGVLTCWVVAGDKSPAFSKSSHHFLLEATHRGGNYSHQKLLFFSVFIYFHFSFTRLPFARV